VDYNYATGVDSNISRLTSISDASGTLEAYSYQGDGTVLTVDRTQPGLTLTKTLDNFGRILDFDWTNGSGSIVRYEYGYDANSDVLYKEDKVNTGLSELYGYDAINQLATMARGPLNSTKDAITGTPDFEQSWNHDSLGNWDDVTTNGIIDDRDSNAQNEYTDVDGNSPGYDANGNMTTDQDGKHFVWDAWNRLVEVQDSSNATLVTYSYDSLNRRVTSDDGTTVTTLYYSTGWQVLQEQVAGDVTQQFVYSPIYPDALILRDRDTDADGVLDERLWVIQDNNFNVLAITDDTGTVVERYKYTAFGVETVLNASYAMLGSSAYAWVHLHQGLRFEEASGLYDNRFRWYSAALGQFVSNDPIGFDAGDVNVRRYVKSRPTSSLDPMGLKDWKSAGGVFINEGSKDEWALIAEPARWVKISPGQRTNESDDCDGATCNGVFFNIENGRALVCKKDGYVFRLTSAWTGCARLALTLVPFASSYGIFSEHEAWTPNSGKGVDPGLKTGSFYDDNLGPGWEFPPERYNWADGSVTSSRVGPDGRRVLTRDTVNPPTPVRPRWSP